MRRNFTKISFYQPEASDGAFWRTISLAYLATSLLGMAIRPKAFTRYLTQLGGFFDTEHYVAIARNGYTAVGQTCFYPLWPMAVGLTARVFGVETVAATAVLAGLLSTAVFLGALRLMIPLLRAAMPRVDADCAVALFAFNPNSLFHAVGYTESFCTLLLLLTIRALRSEGRLWPLLVFAFLTSMARPILVFLPFAALGAALLTSDKRRFSKALAVGAGALLAYAVFAGYLYLRFGDPNASFQAQNAWGRKWGLHWEVVVAPHVVGGSAEVLTWDLLAFYGPLLLTLFGLWWRRRRPDILDDQAFWFCVLLALAHGATQFLTYPLYASLGRHVFGLPMMFYALGRTATLYKPSKRVRGASIFISVVFYLRWWSRFAKASWIG